MKICFFFDKVNQLRNIPGSNNTYFAKLLVSASRFFLISTDCFILGIDCDANAVDVLSRVSFRMF